MGMGFNWALGYMVILHSACPPGRGPIRQGQPLVVDWPCCTCLHTTGELLPFSPIGLSMVTKLAPKRHDRHVAMGAWFLSQSPAANKCGRHAGKAFIPFRRTEKGLLPRWWTIAASLATYLGVSPSTTSAMSSVGIGLFLMRQRPLINKLVGIHGVR
jgi:dipeptide/tripeptide permease